MRRQFVVFLEILFSGHICGTLNIFKYVRVGDMPRSRLISNFFTSTWVTWVVLLFCFAVPSFN